LDFPPQRAYQHDERDRNADGVHDEVNRVLVHRSFIQRAPYDVPWTHLFRYEHSCDVLLVIITLNMEGDLYNPALLSIGLGRVGTLDDVRINQPPRPCVCGFLDVSLRPLGNMALIIQGWIPSLGLWQRKQHAGEDNYRLFFHRFFVLYVCFTLSNPSTSRRSPYHSAAASRSCDVDDDMHGFRD
jgi:hypothetical protein